MLELRAKLNDDAFGIHGETSKYSWVSARWYLYLPGRKDDGTLVSSEPRPDFPGKVNKVQRSTSLAMPLVSIVSADSLRRSVVVPVLKSIVERSADDDVQETT